MNLDPAPRLNKFPFILTAVGCLAVVLLIALFAENRFAPLYFLTAVGFLIASITAIMIPVITDYAADQAESSQALRDQLEAQIARLHHGGESLARAAAQIKAVEEAVHKAARDAETLPYRMQEKLAEFNETLAQQDTEQREALEQELNDLRAAQSAQLKAAAEKIRQTVTELHAIEKSARAQLADAAHALGQLQAAAGEAGTRAIAAITRATTEAEARIAAASSHAAAARPAATPPAAAAPAPVSAPTPPAALPPTVPDAAPIEETAGAPAAPPSPEESVAAAIPPDEPAAPPAVEPAKPKKPRAPRKPKPAEPPVDVSPETDAPTADLVLAAEDSAEPPPPAEASTSSDGATRLLATAYIGIGNKLFIRGDGPGLSWDAGVPMQFVSIGKWGWFTHEAAGPVNCKLYKNDDQAALSGEITLEPGKHTEVTAQF